MYPTLPLYPITKPTQLPSSKRRSLITPPLHPRPFPLPPPRTRPDLLPRLQQRPSSLHRRRCQRRLAPYAGARSLHVLVQALLTPIRIAVAALLGEHLVRDPAHAALSRGTAPVVRGRLEEVPAGVGQADPPAEDDFADTHCGFGRGLELMRGVCLGGDLVGRGRLGGSDLI